MSAEHPAAPVLEYGTSSYDAQREGMALVSGHQVWAQVTGPTGRRFARILIAFCPNKDDADEIADLLAEKAQARRAES